MFKGTDELNDIPLGDVKRIRRLRLTVHGVCGKGKVERERNCQAGGLRFYFLGLSIPSVQCD